MNVVDTDVLVQVLRRDAKAIGWLRSIQEPPGIPGFVSMELKQGCSSLQDLLQVDRLLRRFPIVWPTAAYCEVASALYGKAKLSHGLGLVDALIGATALEHSATLYTFNTRHFAGMPGVDARRPY